MRKLVLAAIAASALAIGMASPASAANFNLTYYEQTTWFQFIDGGAVGRSVGDVFNFNAIEFTTSSYSGAVVGAKSGSCRTYAQEPDGDWMGTCNESINIYGRGTLKTFGSMNQTAFERFETQVLGIVRNSGTGQFVRPNGMEKLTQTRFPDRAKIQLIFNNL